MSDDPDEKEEEPRPITATSQELVTQYERDKDLRSLHLSDGNYTDVTTALVGANMDGVEMFRATLQGLDLTGSSMVDANARRAICTSTILNGADLRKADLTNADLKYADLRDADLRECQLAGARLSGSKVSGMKIDRHALRMLGVEHGGLTDADLATLNVEDDQARITTSFGGFWTALHLIAVLIFLLPYVIFGANRYLAARLSPCMPKDECVALREALFDYIITGGKGSGTDGIAISIFLLLLAYNIFRISLVYKARSLDLAERASGMPRQFTLSGYWNVAYYGCQWLVWVNLFLVVIHAFTLLEMRVPPV